MPKTSLDFETHHRRIPPQREQQHHHYHSRHQQQQTQKQSSQRLRRSVSFGESVTVHWHQTILGDHPGPKSGPPLALGWNAVLSEELSLASAPKVTRRGSLRLSPGTRIGRLQRAGVSFLDMHLVIEEGKAIRSEREACRSNTNTNNSTINNTTTNENVNTSNNNNFAPIRRKRLSLQSRPSRKPTGRLPIRGSLESLASYRLRSPERPDPKKQMPQAPPSPTSVLGGPFGAQLPPPPSQYPFRRAKKLLSISRRSLLAKAA
jgi:hypothetical protein